MLQSIIKEGGQTMRQKKTKIGSIVLCTLFFVTALPTITGISDTSTPLREKTSNDPGNILYVGGSGPGNYTKIQDAINTANDGDIIFVYPGIYYENILIYKSLYIEGENAETTIIDGQKIDHVVLINTDFVTVKGFTIRNSSSNTSGTYAGIKVESNHTTISKNNIIENDDAGIYLTQVSSTTISENTISENNNGIWVSKSSDNSITNNTIHNNSLGIFLRSSSKNQIIENTIHHNGEYGILLYDSTQNNVQDNSILIQDYIGTGVSLRSSSQNTLQSNTIAYNKNIGISLEGSGSNVISENTIQGNNRAIILDWGQNNKITRNNFIENLLPAVFSLVAPCRFLKILVRNSWMNNYWDDHLTGFPKLISGTLSYPPDLSTPWYHVSIPWYAIDWHPAQEPYLMEGESS
jgi:parallel beta-helix repeat protein